MMKMRRFFLMMALALGCSLAYGGKVSLPFPILGGELSNSAATCVEDIDEVMPRMKALGLNTVLVPAYWEFLEPTEGRFDFTLIDRTVDKARENDLRVIFLWFGAWKNSMSCYAPLWFKQDTKRFPRAMTEAGKPLEIASCFSDNVLQADLKAFTALMQHLADKDKGTGTVIMMQIENEIGMLESARDHSPLAEKAYKQPVPADLLKLQGRFFSRNERTVPIGTWADIFGTDEYADEKFMAYHYAKYVEHLAQAARHIYDMPLYVNAAMNSRGRKPGEYPSAGPLAHLIDFWHCGAPSIDILAPDIYDTGFKGWADKYALPNNQLFIPESRCCENSGVRALYAFGEHQAIGFSPFAIDQASPRETESVTKAYGILRQLANYKHHNSNPKLQRQWGMLFDQEDKERIILDGQTAITCRHYFTLPWDPRATNGSIWPEGGAILLRLAQNEYLLAGSGIVVDFKTKTEKEQEVQKALGEDGFVEAGGSRGQVNDSGQNQATSPLNPPFTGHRLGIGFVDEVTISETGQMKYLRRHNGDQDHQGRHARISIGEWKILHIKLYEY